MSADTTSVFYQVGQAVATQITSNNSTFLGATNTFTATQTFADVVIGTGYTIQLTDHVDHGVLYSDTAGNLSTKAGFEYDASSDTLKVSNLSVTGTTTTLTTTNTEIKDNVITLSKGANTDASYSKDSGIFIERAQGSNSAALVWDETSDRFAVGTLLPVAEVRHRRYTIGTAVAGEFYYLYAVGTYATSNFIDVNINSTGNTGSPSTDDPIYYETYGPQDELVLNLPSSVQTVGELQAYLDNFDYTGLQYAVGGSTPNTDVSSDSRLYVALNTAQSGTSLVNYDGAAGATTEVITPAEDASTGTDDTLRITPGEFQVGGLTINTQPLGDYADFTAGLNA